jgi:pimeloyl-ACP methyl ester carboxylesterase
VLGVVLVDTLHDVSQRRSIESARADAEHLSADFAGYFADLSSLFSNTSDASVRHWVERQAQAADPAAAIGLKLDTPNVDPRALFQRAGVPIRAINAKPPWSEVTAVAENRRYGDYQATLIEDAGHFLPLERPQAFNAALKRWVASLSR